MENVSIIIPAYNEEKTIGNLIIDELKNQMKEYEYEIIVVDDGSKDNTAKVVEPFTLTP
ncbi:MAG: glycosyltransferase [bacterium]